MITRFAALPVSIILLFSAGLVLASAANPTAPPFDLPSGAQVYLQETLQDGSGDYGLTQRFRFIMPDLALRVPSTSGSATDFSEGHDAPQEIDTQAMGPEDGVDGDYLDDDLDDGMISAEDLDFQPVISIPGAEEAADHVIDLMLSPADDAEALPAAPDVLFKDPIHDDIVWICNNIALPEALKSAKRPEQIVVSLADRESVFGSYDPDVLQIFESFSLPKDKDTCEWRPW